jgi:hypothetical protein
MKQNSKVSELMEKPKKSDEMIRKTHYLTASNYSKFEKICQKSGHSASAILDALIQDFVNAHS